ncbi:MAG: winged helix-turn-helix transcriptional regulator [Eubacterium sp.]|nr:winged helix-turn-helix transcriptional regulator [Eubacterium sp.]
MYISQIKDCNLGPISQVDIAPSFDINGNPRPLIIVGENGSGKSTFISNIVDSFYELAGRGFQNALHTGEDGNGYEFYKIIRREKPSITQTELAETMNLSRRSVQTIMKALIDEGIIERSGSKKSGTWIVK